MLRKYSILLFAILAGAVLAGGVLLSVLPTQAAVEAEQGKSIQTNIMQQKDDKDADDEAKDDELDWIFIAAKVIGIDEESLWTGLDNGRTLAELAEANGVAPQAVIDAISEAETVYVNKWLESGKATDEEIADLNAWLPEIPEEVTTFVMEPFAWDEWEGEDWFEIATQTLGMEEDALWEALEQGQTFEQIATAQNVDPQALVNAIVEAETTFINELLTDEEITQEEADEWLTDLNTEINELLTMPFDKYFEEWDEEAYWTGVDWYMTAAEVLNVDEETLFEALKSGQSLADFAQAQGVDAEIIAEAIIAAETAETTKYLEELPEKIQFFLNESWEKEPAEFEK